MVGRDWFGVVGASLGGAIVGSVLTTVIERLPRGESFLRGRSRCPRCSATLAVSELIPVVSFVVQRGRCRHCAALIPGWHLGVEFAAIALTVAAVLSRRGQPWWDLASLLAALAILLALAVIDLRDFVLPDVLVGALALVGGVRALVAGAPTIPSAAFGAVVGAGLLWGLGRLPWHTGRQSPASSLQTPDSGFQPRDTGNWQPATGNRSAMGFGDVKLAGAMGISLGLPGVLAALFVAFLSGGLVGGALVLSKRATMRSRIPFGPFLAAATALVLWFPDLPLIFSRLLGFGVG